MLVSPTFYNLTLFVLQDCSPFAAAWHMDKDAISKLFYNLTSGELAYQNKNNRIKRRNITA